jgi:hypothetical protein
MKLNLDRATKSTQIRYGYYVRQISVTYTFDYEGTDSEVCMDIILSLTPKNNICVSFRLMKGNDIYYKYLVARIHDEFSYCKV